MHVLITGAGGFLGGKLARALAARGRLKGRPISALTLHDLAAPGPVDADFPVARHAGDLSRTQDVARVFATGPFDVIFHLAALASAGSEADFDDGLAANLSGTLNLLQASRASGSAPVVVFSSTVAVHGGEEPEIVPDGVELNPQTSYGTQKAMAELLLNDMTRRGFIDGRGLRLPTVTIRPGKANTAASSFMSSIFRDTLQGDTANCPVAEDFPIWHTAPRTVIGNLIHGAELDRAAFGMNRCLNLPGRTGTVAEMIAAMTRVAGAGAAGRITWEPDPAIAAIVTGWRNHFRPEKALGLGFQADRSFEDNVRWFLEDDIRRSA